MSTENKDIAQSVIDYIGYSDAALTKAASVIEAQEAVKEKVASLIPAAVEACVENERVEAHQKEALAEALTDHAQAIELLTKLAAHRNDAEQAPRLGTPVGTKSASYDPSNSLTSGYVGARDGRLKASDIKLFEGLGLNPPTS